jgi:hypothetical protein
MTPESMNSSLLGNGSVNIPAEANAHNSRRAVFSVVCVACSATQRFDKHISAAVNQHVTILEGVCSVGAAPRLYNEDLGQLRELNRVRSWQLQQRIEGVSGIGSWQNNGKKELGSAKKSTCEINVTDCYESVARIRLVKTEDASVTVIRNVWKSAIAL